MNREEVLKLLTFAASIDKRTVDQTDVRAWHLLLAPIDYQRAQGAVVSHFRHKPGVYLEPGHIWEGAKTTTEGDSREAARALALTAECDHGSFCRTCKSVHHPDESCDVLVASPGGLAKVIDMFRPPPLAITTAAHEELPPELSAAETAAAEAERARQIAALDELIQATA